MQVFQDEINWRIFYRERDAVSPLIVLPTFVPADPVNVPGGQKDRTAPSLAAIDPDSHAIIVGTDNNLPGNVIKYSSGGSSDLTP